MKEHDIAWYKKVALNQMAAHLNEEYYSVIIELCDTASEIALRLRAKEIEEPAATEIYTVLSINFTKHLRQHQEHRISVIIPYLQSLFEKEAAQHNCANCDHNCRIDHAAHVAFLKQSNEVAKTHLHRLSNIAVPVETGLLYNGLYTSLRDKMFLIEKNLLECRFIEETILIPKMLLSQKAINATDLSFS